MMPAIFRGNNRLVLVSVAFLFYKEANRPRTYPGKYYEMSILRSS
jgi:hypothetical protein